MYLHIRVLSPTKKTKAEVNALPSRHAYVLFSSQLSLSERASPFPLFDSLIVVTFLLQRGNILGTKQTSKQANKRSQKKWCYSYVSIIVKAKI